MIQKHLSFEFLNQAVMNISPSKISLKSFPFFIIVLVSLVEVLAQTSLGKQVLTLHSVEVPCLFKNFIL